MGKPKKVLVVHIKEKTLHTLKSLVVIDLLFGSGIYFAAKLVTSSLVIATMGSMAGCEGYKWRLRRRARRVVAVPISEWRSLQAKLPAP